MVATKTTKVKISLTPGDIRTLGVLQRTMGKSRSAIIRLALQHYLVYRVGNAHVRALFKPDGEGGDGACMVMARRESHWVVLDVFPASSLSDAGEIAQVRYGPRVRTELIVGDVAID